MNPEELVKNPDDAVVEVIAEHLILVCEDADDIDDLIDFLLALEEPTRH